MVARVVSKDVVELDVVDLIGCLGHESLEDDCVLFLAHGHPEVVEDGAEASERNEARSASVLVLEVGLDEQASVLHLGAQAL